MLIFKKEQAQTNKQVFEYLCTLYTKTNFQCRVIVYDSKL